MTAKKSDLYITKTFSYLYDILEDMRNNRKLKHRVFNWAGGRQTGKTANAMIFTMIASDIMQDKQFVVYLIRKVISNNHETFDQYLALAPKRMKDEWYKNSSLKLIKNNRNLEVRSLGLREHKNAGKIEHLGLKRYKTNSIDYTIIIFDEAFEFNEEDIAAVKQAVGGYKELITFYCSNPWDINTFFFKKMMRVLPWTESIMKTEGEQFLKRGREIYHWTNYLKTKADNLLSEDGNDEIEASIEEFPARGDVIYYGKPAMVQDTIFNINKIRWLTRKQLFSDDSIFKGDCIARFGVDYGYTNHPSTVFFCLVKSDGSFLAYDNLTIPHKNREYDAMVDTTKMLSFMTAVLDEVGLPHDGSSYATVYCDSENATMKSLFDRYNKDNRLLFYNPRKSSVLFKRNRRLQELLIALHKNKIYALQGRCADWVSNLAGLKYKFKTDGDNMVEEDRSVGENDMYDACCYALYEEIIRKLTSR